MKRIKKKLMNVTVLAGVVSLIMTGNIFANSVDTSQIKVGSGNATGLVDCYNTVSGNGTTGYYAEATTQFMTKGSACSGVRIGVQMTVKNGITTLYTDKKYESAKTSYGASAYASVHSGFYSSKNIKSTTTHTLSGPITFSRTLVTNY